jgi:dolichyl-phosphate-mannose-protein mannosyltransferase
LLKQTSRIIVIILMLITIQNAAVAFAEESLPNNGSFEKVEGNMPVGWSKDAWKQDDNSPLFTVETGDTHSGSFAVGIENVQENDAKWTQEVSVQPDSLYKISGWVKIVKAGTNSIGANISVLGLIDAFPQVTDTGGKWVELQFFGKTDSKQTKLILAARLGSYGYANTGKALFDDLSIERVDKSPEGVPVLSLGIKETAEPTTNPPATVHVSAFPIIIISVLFSLLFALIYKRLLKKDTLALDRKNQRQEWFILVLLFLALIVRIWIAVKIRGFQVDIQTFILWADRAVEHGFSGFYQEGVFTDYPPGYIYILYILGSIKALFSWGLDSVSTRLLFKSPAIIADLITAFMIYRIGKAKVGAEIAAGLSMLYAFNPAIIINSAAWGQVDASFTLALILSIIYVSEKRLERASVWFAIATLIKPQALIFTPVLLLAFLNARSWKLLAKSALYGAGTFLLLAAPFFLNNGGLRAIFNLYKSTLASYPYASVNAYNWFALLGKNWVPLDQKWLFISYQAWGNLAIIFAVLCAAGLFFAKRRDDQSRYFFIALVLIAIIFVLGVKMHERYIFPALLLILFSFLHLKDRRLLYLFFGFSVTNFINVGYVSLHSNVGIYHLRIDSIVFLCSLATVGLLIYLLYVGYDIYFRNRINPLTPLPKNEQRIIDQQILSRFANTAVDSTRKVFFQRKDWIWMGGITLIYTVIAMYHLGSNKGPETYWKPSVDGESFYVDFGESKQLERINSFGGVGTGRFSYEFSVNSSDWTARTDIDQSVGKVFVWNSQQTEIEARYVRIIVQKTGFELNEMAFYERNSSEPISIKQIYPENASGGVQHLFDEQSIAVYKPSFMNGTYFDEIYHARSAYEILHGIEPYENTHPPLGKLLIAFGIKLFGLNPFGWRIMGTLFGIAMLPILYLFALRLFRKTEYAVIATFLLAVDFMHFTQSRIATIDVYSVFFSLLMFYFMYRYYSLNMFGSFRKSLVLLFWSGLFFGIGFASKWIVAYGGAGLAVLFFMAYYERYRQYAAAKRILTAGNEQSVSQRASYHRIVRLFPRYSAITLVSCIVFFILIPILIYGLAYIPIPGIKDDGGYSISKLWNYQKNMYNYHSHLVATHPFSSTWWEWPLIKRPVWYYSGSGLGDDQISSIVVLGNPLVWWAGIVAVFAFFWITIRRKDKESYVVWIAFFSLYIPWALVTRLTFIYHYFSMVPFMILALTYMLKWIDEKKPSFKFVRNIYLVLSGLLFILFYPVLSGMTVNKSYVMNALHWFSSWVF